jgi:hypothetical protein
MKTMTLIGKLQDLMKKPPEETPIKKLRKTIKALKEKQKELEKRLRRTEGKHARERLQQKIEVLKAQRRKGADLYKRLKGDNGDGKGGG